MSNHQADMLRIAVLGGDLSGQTWLALPPTHLPHKQLKKLAPGVLIEGFDPLRMRLVRDGEVIARAKLGHVGGQETLHIVASDSTPYASKRLPSKHALLEARLRVLGDRTYAVGEVVTFDDPLTGSIVLVADGVPVATGEIVEYADDVLVRIVQVLHG